MKRIAFVVCMMFYASILFATDTLYKGSIGSEDINWGSGSFDRRTSTGATIPMSKVNDTKIPVSNQSGYYLGDLFHSGHALHIYPANITGDNTGTISGFADLKVRGPWVDVRVYGASTSASGAINLAAFASAIGTGNVTVIVPSGIYSIAAPGIDLKDNTTIIGIGLPTLVATDNYVMSINRGSGGSADPSGNIKNVVIDGIRFKHTGGFSEDVHQLNINAATNVLVQNCVFYAFRGDGIYVGSSNVVGTERHNNNIKIRNNYFDGYNNDNRNGITVIDGSGVVIENNYFTNTTKSTMPGAIDIEPDGYAFHRIRNIVIQNNYIENSGKNGIQVFITDTLTIPIFGISILNNYIDNCVGYGLVVKASHNTSNLSQSSSPQGILVQGNTVKKCGYPMIVYGMKGASFLNNTFDNTTGPISFGSAAYDRVKSFDVEFTGNKLTLIGTGDNHSMVIDGIKNLTMTNNVFNDCGDNTASGSCIDFAPSATATVSNILFTGNNFFKTALTNMKAVTQSGGGTITWTYNNIFANYFNGLTSIWVDDSPTTWNVNIYGSSTAGDNVTYTTRYGAYTRISNRVFFEISLVWTSHNGTGDMRIDLPIAPVGADTAVTILHSSVTHDNTLAAQVNQAGGYIKLLHIEAGAAAGAVGMDTAGELELIGHYRIN